jgi:Fic family protein
MNPPRPATGAVGYAWLRDLLGEPSFLGGRDARIASVTSIERSPEGPLLVPRTVAPDASLLAHILFALKHEGVNLHLLTLSLRKVPAGELAAAFASTPNGVYIRQACYLWEQVTGEHLSRPADASITAPYAAIFDSERYITGKSRRSAAWRVDFNGLGDLGFCPIVRRTPVIQQLLAEDLLAQAREFADQTGKAMLDRALSWAYLSETEGSFAIEGEIPTQSKAAAFANLLKQASDPQQLTEDYLVSLQNATITNPLDKAVQFRNEQNRLQKKGILGAAGVAYVPPAPELAAELMERLMQLANEPPPELDPLVHAAILSFGFVFIHPFMDGNGRLSRFLIHHSLGQSGKLPKAFVLPVSVAMKRNEEAYLDALTDFSKPARELCAVTWLGNDNYTYDWKPDAAAAFRYADLTPCVEFTLQMAKVALEQDLQRETQFLVDFDRTHRKIDDRFDIRGTDLSNLIVFAFQHDGRLSNNRRKQYGERVQAEALDAIEAEVQACLAERARAEPQEDGTESATRAPRSTP